MPQITLDTVVRIHEDAVFRELGGEAVLLQLATGMYFGLDPVGTRLWQLLEQHQTLRTTAAAAAREFEAEIGVLERDLVALVAELEAKQLVVLE